MAYLQKTNAKVSVIISSYNHSQFIERAIESVFAQKTNFPIQLVVADDCSTDGNVDILKRLQLKYGDKLEVYFSEKRQGPFANPTRVYKELTGEYIAFLDGDDEWIYDEKLALQVAYLDANSSVVGCFHDAKIKNHIQANDSIEQQHYKGFKRYSQIYQYNEYYYPWDALSRVIIPNSSLVVRKCEMDNALSLIHPTDYSPSWMLLLYLIRDSKMYYINEEWSFYNDHNSSLTKTVESNKFRYSNIEILRKIQKQTYYKAAKNLLYQAKAKEYYYLLSSSDFRNHSSNKKMSIAFHFFLNSMLYVLHDIKYAFFRGRFKFTSVFHRLSKN